MGRGVDASLDNSVIKSAFCNKLLREGACSSERCKIRNTLTHRIACHVPNTPRTSKGHASLDCSAREVRCWTTFRPLPFGFRKGGPRQWPLWLQTLVTLDTLPQLRMQNCILGYCLNRGGITYLTPSSNNKKKQ